MTKDYWDDVSEDVAKAIGEGREYGEPDEDDKTKITKDDVLRLFDVLDDWEQNHRGEDWTIDLTWDDEGKMEIRMRPGKMDEG